jgi:predicted XRE-type DNA-binding protein
VKASSPVSSQFGARHITPAGRSVFHDLFPPEEAAELEMRSVLLLGLEDWLANIKTQSQAAEILGTTQARISDIKRGKIRKFSLDLLVRLAARAGLRPKLRLAA